MTTARDQKANVMTMSWHTMIDFEPPILGCVMSDQNFSFDLLKETKECVINIPTVEMLPQIVAIGNTSGRDIDKIEKFNLKIEKATFVQAPLLSQCYANLECKVIDIQNVKKYDLFILEVVQGWMWKLKKRAKTVHHCGDGVFVVDGQIIKTSSSKK